MGAYDPAKPHHRPGRSVWYRLVCPAACGGPVAEDAHEAARLIGEHASVCPDPGPAWRPVSGGAVIRPLIYADRIKR
jgi:hypothetical protein